MGIIPGNFTNAFTKYKIRKNGVWEDEPVLSIKVTPSSFQEVGTYTITYPNPKGALNNYVLDSDTQEIFLADPATSIMYRIMTGRINNIDNKDQYTLVASGRDLSGSLFDRQVVDAWEDKAIDFIIDDETFGVMATYFPTITTFNSFMVDYDDFASWSTARWGTQPSWASIDAGILKLTGAGASTLTLTDTNSYNYQWVNFKARVTTNQDYVYLGVTDGTNYIRFRLNAAGVVACQNSNGTPQSSDSPDPHVPTNYNYYRIEWSADSIRFFVNGVLEVTSTLNIPTGNLSPYFQLDTVTSELWVDYMKVILPNDVLPRYVALNRNVHDVIEDLCKQAGATDIFIFYIDSDYDLHCHERQTIASNLQFGNLSTVYPNNIYVIDSLLKGDQIKNTINVYGGEKLTTVVAPTWTDKYIGNGVTTSYILGYKAKKPLTQVEVNGVPVIENTDFTVNYGTSQTVIKFNTAPGNTLTINIRYDYFTKVLGFAQNETSITDNNRGIKEMNYTDPNIQSQDVAQLVADGLLKLYSDPRISVTFSTRLMPLVNVGMTVMVDSPPKNIFQQTYEVMKVDHDIPSMRTNFQLISTEITTVPETFKAIIKMLSDLQTLTQDPNAPAVKSFSITEELEFTEEITFANSYVCDSFIYGNPRNGLWGVGTYLDSFESGVIINWTSGSFIVGTSTSRYLVGSASMTLSYAGTGAMTVNSAQSFGNLSTYTGANSGAPIKGCVGVWIYQSAANQISSISLKLGSSGSNYAQKTGAIVDIADGNASLIGWNYYVFPLATATITGTPVWTATAYCDLIITLANGNILYVDYLTISSQNTIGNNGYGSRTMVGVATDA